MGDSPETFSIAAAATALLENNWRAGKYRKCEYGFSVPSPRSYPWQWYWDSCFHAIVRRRYDAAKARRELETLLNAMTPDGFIGHTILWEQPLDLGRALRYNIASRRDLMTATIQPPVLAWAWAWAVGDPRDEPRIEQHHDWLREHRALADDGLLWLIQPDESGMDASPKFDHVWGQRAQGTLLFPTLIWRNRRHGFDARQIKAAGHPVVCEVMTNVGWCLSEIALGRPSLTGALIERCWDERTGRFYDEAQNPVHALDRAARPRTWDTLAPLALPDLPEEIAERLVDEVLRSPAFDNGIPLPAVALDDPSFSDRELWAGRRHRHWRGPSWINSAWLVSLGLRRLGLGDEAERMAQRLLAVVEREGFREYYNPRSGHGMGARDFGWSTLLWEIAAPEPPTFLRAP